MSSVWGARFADAWVVDASMYTHFKSGCVCGASSSSSSSSSGPAGPCLPAAVAASVARCRDLPGGAAALEARVSNPWPPEVREEVWRHRVLFRRLLRGLRAKIAAAGSATRARMRALVANPGALAAASSASSATASSAASSGAEGRHVIAGARVEAFLEDHFPGFYGTLLRKLLQQVAAFSTTGMRRDGTGAAEYAYEGAIRAASPGSMEDATLHVRVVRADASSNTSKKKNNNNNIYNNNDDNDDNDGSDENNALPYLERLLSDEACAGALTPFLQRHRRRPPRPGADCPTKRRSDAWPSARIAAFSASGWRWRLRPKPSTKPREKPGRRRPPRPAARMGRRSRTIRECARRSCRRPRSSRTRTPGQLCGKACATFRLHLVTTRLEEARVCP